MKVKVGHFRSFFMLFQFPISVTLAFCRTLPFVAIMETGLFFSADAELTGEPVSALTLLFDALDVEHDEDK